MRRSIEALWLLLIAVCVLAAIVLSTMAFAQDGENDQDLLVLVVLEKGLPAEVEPAADPGRIEVTNKGAFVGCMFAPYHVARGGDVTLLPNSVGYRTRGKPADINVETFGELRRVAKPQVIIKEIGR